MMERLALDLVEEGLVANQLVLTIVYNTENLAEAGPKKDRSVVSPVLL